MRHVQARCPTLRYDQGGAMDLFEWPASPIWEDEHFWWTLFAVLAVAMGVFASLWQRKPDAQRRACLKWLAERADIAIRSHIVESGLGDDSEARRLRRVWLVLCKHFEIPPRKLRVSDRLDGGLAGAIGHYDYALVLACQPPCFELGTKEVNRCLADAVTWGDLLLRLREMERRTGREMVW